MNGFVMQTLLMVEVLVVTRRIVDCSSFMGAVKNAFFCALQCPPNLAFSAFI